MIEATTSINPSKIRNDEWSTLLVDVGKNQDQESFKALFDHFSPLIKGFCLSNTHQGFSRESADEIVQEVMLKVWQKAPMYDPAKAAASTWIFTVMRNARIDLMRKNKNHNDTSDIEVDDLWEDDNPMGPVIQFQKTRNRQLISQSLETLPIEQRQALTAVYLGGKSHSEVASETGLPLGTVKSRVRMGLHKVQSYLSGKAILDGGDIL